MTNQVVARPRIEVRGLVKSFRRVGGVAITPVDHVDLTVAKDELVVLLGPSGCGKTTLLRCVAGLERPDEGEIIIDGVTVFSSTQKIFIPAERRRVSMVFQSFALWPHMTVAANVAYPLECDGELSELEIRARVEKVLSVVGVAGLGQQYPGRISGGQQQRVALARALVSNSTVVLFDEPLSNVDAQVRTQLRAELKRMQKEFGFSGLYVTHDQTEAMELGHRVAVLDSGKITALGTPREVYTHPVNEYVANFVGAANILPGTITRVDNAQIHVSTSAGYLIAGPSPHFTPLEGKPCLVVIRPERVSLVRGAPEPTSTMLSGVVESRVFAGPHTEYVVRCRETAVRVWSHGTTEADELEEGTRCTLSVDPNQVSLIERGAMS